MTDTIDSKKINTDYKFFILNALNQFQNLAKDPETVSITTDNLDAKLIIFTNYALLECEIDDDSVFNSALVQLSDTFDSRNESLQMDNITGSLHLKNIRMKTFSQPNTITSLERLTLFTDQIAGVTTGTIDNLG